MGHVREQLFRHLHERCVATKTGSRAQECAKCRLRDRPLGRTLLELRSPKPNPALLHVHTIGQFTTQPPSIVRVGERFPKDLDVTVKVYTAAEDSRSVKGKLVELRLLYAKDRTVNHSLLALRPVCRTTSV